jgi:hypothetical protein
MMIHPEHMRGKENISTLLTMQASRLDIVHERNNNKEPPSPKQ